MTPANPPPTRILLRSPRDLLRQISPMEVLRDNRIGNNSGNLIYAHAVQRALSVSNARISVDLGRIDVEDAPRINDEFDVYVIPLANAFRASFHDHLNRYSELIERLKIPVVVVGVGVQLHGDPTGENPGRLDRILPSVHRFVRAVLERSASIGVRGEVSYRFLRDIGYGDSDVTVIGCPSLYQFGPTLNIKKGPALTDSSRLSLNVSPYVRAMGPITTSHANRYPNLRYIAQGLATLQTLLYCENPPDEARRAPDIPYRVTDQLLADGRTRFFIDPTTWIDYLRDKEFSFGSRIHGNIAALLAGTPAVVLGHDSRTVELAEYHEIPYQLASQVDPTVDASELFEWADYTPFMQNQQGRFDAYLRFLELNGLEHVFTGSLEASEGVANFDHQVARARSKGPVLKATRSELAYRRSVRSIRRLPRKFGLQRAP